MKNEKKVDKEDENDQPSFSLFFSFYECNVE